VSVSCDILGPGTGGPGGLDGKRKARFIDDDIRAVYLDFESTPRLRVSTNALSEEATYREEVFAYI
jgi:hypothetical protein